MLSKLGKYTSEDQQDNEKDSDWYLYIKKFFKRLTIFGGLMLVIVIIGGQWALSGRTFIHGRKDGRNPHCVVIYIGMAIFAGPMMNLHNSLYTALWLKHKSFRWPLAVFNLIKVGVVTMIAMVPLWSLFKIRPVWLFIIVIGVMAFAGRSDRITSLLSSDGNKVPEKFQ